MILQEPLPVDRVPAQLSPVLAFTVTLPVGWTVVTACVTLKSTITACPVFERLGLLLVMVVVVSARFTTWLTALDVLGPYSMLP